MPPETPVYTEHQHATANPAWRRSQDMWLLRIDPRAGEVSTDSQPSDPRNWHHLTGGADTPDTDDPLLTRARSAAPTCCAGPSKHWTGPTAAPASPGPESTSTTSKPPAPTTTSVGWTSHRRHTRRWPTTSCGRRILGIPDTQWLPLTPATMHTPAD